MSIDVRKTAKDAGYVTVGIGVIATQQAQLRRRALQRTVGDQVRQTHDRIVDELRLRVEPLASQLQTVPDQLSKLVETGRDRVQQLRTSPA